MRQFAMVVLAAAALAGCQSLSIASDYDAVKQQDFHRANIDWVVLDRPAENRLLLRPSLGDMAAAGKLAQDLGVDRKIDGFEEVIQAWFKSRGRTCAVTSTDAMANNWRQFHYRCS